MSFKPILSSNSQEQNNGLITDMFREVYARETTEVYKDDTGTRRVLIGKGADGFYGLKVSKPGFDVYDTADVNLGFNSDTPTLRLLQQDTFQITPTILTTGTQATFTKTVSFNQSVTDVTAAGLTPVVLAFDLNGGYWSGVKLNSFGLSGAGVTPNRTLIYSFGSSTTDITLSLQALNGSGTSWTPLTETGYFMVLAQTAS